VKLVIGLGNPGSRYACTRHNVGFRVVDALAQRVDVPFHRTHADYAEARYDGSGGPVVLLKPLTYMNLSGRALAAWLAAARQDATAPDMPAPELLVVCDDIHLPLGTVRIRARGSAGGQKGLASLLEVVGGLDLPRVRLGVGPGEAILDPQDWADYVLAEFAPGEAAAAAALIERGVVAVLDCLATGPQAAGARHNGNLPTDA
jgi:PTH1 family peptidyl-tRNA hydrolase